MGHHHSHAHGHSHGGHGHSHDHGNASNWAFFWAVTLNLAFTIGEAIYAVLANSMSLLADAGHNLGDVFGLALSWLASWLLTRPANERYSYGYKRTSILAAITNALLLVLATGIIGYESVLRLFSPTPVVEKIIMIVAALGIVINGSTALLFIKNSDGDLNIKSAFLHLASDALLSLGVVVTGAVVLYTHWLWLDPIAGLVIVVTILFGTWGLMRDSVNLILDAVPRNVNQDEVRAYLEKLPGVAELHDLHIWGLSTKEIALTAHLIMPDHSLSDEEYHHINDYLKHKFNIAHVTIQVERGSIHNPCGQADKC